MDELQVEKPNTLPQCGSLNSEDNIFHFKMKLTLRKNSRPAATLAFSVLQRTTYKERGCGIWLHFPQPQDKGCM